MFRFLFRFYRASPFWLRNTLGRLGRILGLLLRPFTVFNMGTYKMALDFADNASFKYASDRGGYERDEVASVLRALDTLGECNFIDLGANYGAFSLAASAHIKDRGGLGHVLAVEPDPRPSTSLQRSVRLNGLEAICKVLPVIAGNEDGTERLWVNSRSSADNRTHAVTSSPIRIREEHVIQTRRLDTVVKELGMRFDLPLVVKADIQGNEPRAFAGMTSLLSDSPQWLLLFEHAPYLVESAGLSLSDFAEFVADLHAEHAAESMNGEPRELTAEELRCLILEVPSRGNRTEGHVTNVFLARGLKPGDWRRIVFGN